MKKLYRLLFGLHLFVGIGAIFGGGMAILNPAGPGGMSKEALVNSPFENFLIPGIVLFTIIGLGNVVSAITIRYRTKFQGYISSVFSWALVIWIIVQCIMLRGVVILHVIYLCIGLFEGALSTLLLFKQKLFPANMIIKVYDSLGEG